MSILFPHGTRFCSWQSSLTIQNLVRPSKLNLETRLTYELKAPYGENSDAQFSQELRFPLLLLLLRKKKMKKKTYRKPLHRDICSGKYVFILTLVQSNSRSKWDIYIEWCTDVFQWSHHWKLLRSVDCCQRPNYLLSLNVSYISPQEGTYRCITSKITEQLVFAYNKYEDVAQNPSRLIWHVHWLLNVFFKVCLHVGCHNIGWPHFYSLRLLYYYIVITWDMTCLAGMFIFLY